MQFGLNLLAQVSSSNSQTSMGFGPIYPNRYGLPGSALALSLTSGIVYYGLLLVLVGLVLSAGLWAVGSFSNNNSQTVNGKRGFLICAVCAVAIGAAYEVIQWFFNAGQSING